MASMFTRIGNTEFRTENGRTTATGPNGTFELADGETWVDPETGAKFTPHSGGSHIIGNVTGGLHGDFN